MTDTEKNGRKAASRSKKEETTDKGASKTELAGFARVSKSGKALNLSLDMNILKDLTPSDGKDGQKFVNASINVSLLDKTMDGEREFAPIVIFPEE